jgi:5-methylcytosine-specific restriction endonuclease McrA
MLRRDPAAGFVKSGFSIFSRYRFEAAGFEARRSLNQGAHARLQRSAAENPVLAGEDKGRKRRWWLYQGEYYREEEGLDARAVLALILERDNQKDRRLKRAIALMEQSELLDETKREPIPDVVRVFVWNRDGGRCVQCGGRERLEFDHLIPFSMGGSNTARNLQLLCEACNRAKGGSLV